MKQLITYTDFELIINLDVIDYILNLLTLYKKDYFEKINTDLSELKLTIGMSNKVILKT